MRRCESCQRPFPATKLELWMEVNGYSYQTLADRLGLHKNLLFRLNHQPPDHPHRRHAREAQEVLLDFTGLLQSDLCNELPTGGTSWDKKPLAEVAAADALDQRAYTPEPAVSEGL